MCGISLLIGKNNNFSLEKIYEMNKLVHHRGPDDEGFYFDKNFAFGHRRLAILDLSKAGHQPMEYQNLVIIFNGEIYNYIELRETLEGKGHKFRSKTDTEVILASYKEWGTDSFSKFNGMWAFAIYDKEKNEIILCRDHFGIKPLNYYYNGTFFSAASEIKQFTSLHNFDRTIDANVAVNFLSSGLLNYSENTFFKYVKELRGGYYLKYNLQSHTFQLHRWYNLSEAIEKNSIDYTNAQHKVYDLFVKSLLIRNRSDVSIGSCLSGGIDSSAIVSTIHSNKLHNSNFKTITSCFDYKKYDEQTYSDLVTNQTGFQSLKVFPRLDDLLEKNIWDEMIYYHDQPIPSASHFSEYCVFKTARENGLIVMLDGQGADEYFGGYGEFFQSSQWELIKRLKLNQLITNLYRKSVTNKRSFNKESLSFINHIFLGKVKKSIKEILHMDLINTSWLLPEYAKLANNNFSNDLLNFKALSILEMERSSLPYQLHSEDRNSMLFSVESRLPYLDPDLVEFVIGLPTQYKCRKTINKAILRDAVSELPDTIRLRKDKMGFEAPGDIWFFENAQKLRAELQKAVMDLDYFVNPSKVMRYYDDCIINKRVYLPYFFRIISLHKWKLIFNGEFKDNDSLVL
jgi:asparagine synthase (glutamine-hydrolysing)